MTLGIVFLVLGLASQRTFLFPGIVFLIIAFVAARRQRHDSQPGARQ